MSGLGLHTAVQPTVFDRNAMHVMSDNSGVEMAEATPQQELWLVTDRERELTYGAPVGHGHFRITATTLSRPGRIRYGAIVDTEVAADGTLQVGRLISRSPYRSASALLDRGAIDSPELTELKLRVIDAGGMWEQLLGGILFVHLPRESGVDPRAEIDRLRTGANPPGREPAGPPERADPVPDNLFLCRRGEGG